MTNKKSESRWRPEHIKKLKKIKLMVHKNYDLLENLTKDELNQFRKAIDNNFQVIKDKEKTITDYHSVWFDLYNKCLKYSYLNNKEITNGYPVMEDRTFGDMVKIMINQQLKTKE